MEAADWDSRRELLTNIRGIAGRAYPRVSGILRERSWLFFETVLPFLTTAGFVFVYRTLQAPPQYIGFVVLGGAMTAFWLNVMWMMAAQLHWERDQGNLELYFTAPVSMMSILLGMAVGGLMMSGVRAAMVLFVGAILFDVQFQVAQWGLLLATFLLTLAALYGLGMVLASLFLAWGRAAFHLTQLAIEPIYFVSGLNFPVGRLGLARQPGDLGPAPRGGPRRDAPARVRRRARARRHTAAGRGGGDPRGHDRDLHRRRALDAGRAGAPGPPRRRASRPDGSRHRGRRRGHASTRPGRSSRRGDSGAPSGPRPGSAGSWRPTGPTRSCSRSTRSPSRCSACSSSCSWSNVISGSTSAALRGFVVIGSALWSFVFSGIAGLAWSILDDRERYRMLRYIYVEPERLRGRGARPGRRAGGCRAHRCDREPGGRDRVPRRRGGPRRDRLPAPPRRDGARPRIGRGDRHPHGRDLLPDQPGLVALPGGRRGRALPRVRGGVPVERPARPVQAFGLASPLCWWIEGVRRALVPGSPTGIGGPGSVFERLTGTTTPDPGLVLLALLATMALVTLAAILAFRASERRAKDRGLFDRTTGS